MNQRIKTRRRSRSRCHSASPRLPPSLSHLGKETASQSMGAPLEKTMGACFPRYSKVPSIPRIHCKMAKRWKTWFHQTKEKAMVSYIAVGPMWINSLSRYIRTLGKILRCPNHTISLWIAIKRSRPITHWKTLKIFILSNHNLVKVQLLVKLKKKLKRMPSKIRLRAQTWGKHTWTMAKILETQQT